jgi:dipeptide transport system ATP-binding protein
MAGISSEVSAMSALLDVRGLSVTFATRAGPFKAVDDIDIAVEPDEVLAIVGESGSGKSVAMLAVMGLLPWVATVRAERMVFAGRDLKTLTSKQRRDIVGRDMAMVFQEPMSSLNPCFTVGWQIGEALATHLKLDRRARRSRVVELLEQVGIPDAARRTSAFPHQLSGGMNQRVMIAMAISCNPRLLIADEPTTALDVTIQAQILDLMIDLQSEIGMAIQFISHNLAVISEIAHEIIVMYAGRIVERAPAEALFAVPLHPYTHGLIATLPDPDRRVERLPVIPGGVADYRGGRGCCFADRCGRVRAACRDAEPVLEELAPGHFVACIDPGR